MKNIDYEVVIIGAGVIGLAIANALSKQTDKSVLVIEKDQSFGRGISSRNSEVIHSGIYYKHNSLKAKHCIRGRELLYAYCKENSIWHKRCGKLIIAQDEESDQIHKLYNNGIKNGLNNIKILNRKQISKLEPGISGSSGLYIGCTGIVSVHELMQSFYNNSMNSNHDYLFKSSVLSSKKKSSSYLTTIINPYENKEVVSSNWVINCAGLNSDILGKNMFDSPKIPIIEYSKGCYFSLSNKYRNKFKHLIYPLPDQNTDTLGIHLTFDKNGSNRLGPNAIRLNNRNEDYFVPQELISTFYKEASKYIKNLKKSDLTPDYAGIRPKNKFLDNRIADFYIKHEVNSGFPRWVNLIGIESPGITSCISISDDIFKLINTFKS
jgi:L-2-hydroxyglutarate oxidase LhgO